MRKYVVTRGEKPLTWQNSERVASIEAVARLKNGEGPELLVQGSSMLYPQLLAAGLIDRLILMTFPVVLRGGRRLFGEGTSSGAMRMIDHKCVGARDDSCQLRACRPGEARHLPESGAQ
ncbi:MAG: dihydrofolate reductase family protein [Candidatus Eremiobacteraeota bacterium]|nr:dihydrofolate reductase family protein [Candidatus Eremiobacteraeota bacterium]MBC5803553.1 dihydrofolate reductase family protein [Candidatus Eremiobacteraeota bacterium]MBC5822379.1 dihydrofolate reductase family protein [Candidatus Eremiobacteraeota bacterium]